VDEWLEAAAEHLGEGSLSRDEVGGTLRLARDVARGVERKAAPLVAYLAGVAVGRRVGDGVARDEVFAEVTRILRLSIPPPPEGPGGPAAGSG
jgi:hypothetical protein